MIGRITLRNILGTLAPTGVYQHVGDTHPCILMYHCVGGGGYDHITPQEFDRHLEWLKRLYEVVDVGDVRVPGPRKRIALTFDDGLLSFLEHVVPVLERHQLPATVYVIGRTVVSRSRTSEDERLYLSASQVRELAKHPLVTVGSHSMTHPRLARLDSPDAVRREVLDAAAALEDLAGEPIAGFCYPYNNWNEQVREIVSSVHAHAVCGLGDTELLSAQTSPWSMPRINAAVSLYQLRFRVSDAWKRFNRNTL